MSYQRENYTELKTDAPSAPAMNNIENKNDSFTKLFTGTFGDKIPTVFPNIRPGKEIEDLDKIINKGQKNTCLATKLLLGGIFTMPFCSHLVESDEFGFSLMNGRVEFLTPGWHSLAHPFNKYQGAKKANSPLIKVGPVTIIRVPQSQIGLAMCGSEPEILLPGMHCRNDPSFQFKESVSINSDWISYQTIDLLIVKSGTVRISYDKGVVTMLSEGRYAVNSSTFIVGPVVSIQQKNIPFSKHKVLLDGGITMELEGLLTFQLTDVEKLMRQLGDEDTSSENKKMSLKNSNSPLTLVIRALEDVIKAELARTFAGLHLEQISRGADTQPDTTDFTQATTVVEDETKESLLGKTSISSKEGATRDWICNHVLEQVSVIAERWGVHLIKFQLESIKVADEKFAREYEAASLAMSKAKANLRALTAENKIKLQTAQAAADAKKIEAEGSKTAVIIEAKAYAESTVIKAKGNAEKFTIEAKGREEAANILTNQFSKDMMMKELDVNLISGLKAQNLTLVGQGPISTMLQQSLNNNNNQEPSLLLSPPQPPAKK